jgi:cadherin 5 type 2 (VE-cadherin)
MKPRVKVKSNIFFECCDKISAIRTSISALILLLCLTLFPVTQCADLVIRIPHDLSQQDGFYRLDYKPTVGIPPANTTFRPAAISDVIEFSRGAPGTKYEFKLYYSNSSLADWLTWTASITTAPDPPSNLSIGRLYR